MLPSVRIEPMPLITSDFKYNTLLSELVRHVLLTALFTKLPVLPRRSMILTGTISMEQKSVHWLSVGAASRNGLWGTFWLAVFWKWLVTKESMAL